MYIFIIQLFYLINNKASHMFKNIFLTTFFLKAVFLDFIFFEHGGADI